MDAYYTCVFFSLKKVKPVIVEEIQEFKQKALCSIVFY